MRKGLVLAAGLAGCIAVAAVGLPHWLARSTPATAAEKPATGGSAVPVTAGIVKAADVPVVQQGIGTVQAYNMVTIRSRVDGQIVKVDFKEGDEVKAGVPLFQIDPRPYQATLDQAVANSEKDKANLANAQLNFSRDAQIINSNLAVSRQQYDNDRAAVAVDQALVQGDKAQVEQAQLNLSYSTIASPINGRLGARLVDIGNLVHATDAGGLVTVAQLQPIFVSFTLPQDVAHKIREEQAKGQLAVQAFGGDRKTLLSQGKLTLIDNTIDQATGTIRLKATFANADERLWPGEFVNVRVIMSVRKQVPTVPSQTVQEGPEGQYAYVIKPDGTVVRRPVEVAAIQDGLAVISKGLKAGEQVVVDGQYRLIEGARVRVEQEAKSSG